jgi:hypothetical protein
MYFHAPMRTADVYAYYKTYEAIAAAVGITKAGVWMWPDRVPQAHAYKLQILTGGALRVDPSLYPLQKRGTRAPSKPTRKVKVRKPKAAAADSTVA